MIPVVRLFLTASVLSAACLLATEPAAAVGSCEPSATNLCLRSNQFGVSVDWNGPTEMGSGEVFGPSFPDTGFFRFDDVEAAEVMVRVIDGCAFNNFYWVFMAQVSTYGQDVTVTNFESGAVQTYSSLLGELPSPITDTEAFVCSKLAEEPPRYPGSMDSDIFLSEGRFRVSMDWTDFEDDSGAASGVPITDRSGAFWIFDPANLDLLVKMVPDADTGFFAVSLSGITNVAYNLTVQDTCSGQVRVFSNPLGNSGSGMDPMAFPLVCAAQIFADGFESGNTSAWSPMFSSASIDSLDSM